MKRIITIILFALAWASPLQADGVAVKPGLWQMSMTMQIPMLPAPQERSYTECVEETELDPEDFRMEQNSDCSMSEPKVSGHTISWSMECAGPMGPTKGDWSFTSDGDNMRGDGRMVTDMGGQSMEFTMSWTGERLRVAGPGRRPQYANSSNTGSTDPFHGP